MNKIYINFDKFVNESIKPNQEFTQDEETQEEILEKKDEDCDDEDCDDEDEDEDTDEVNEAKKSKKDDKDDKEDKEDDKDKGANKSDEEKYLSPKQRKLPEGLKKAIIKKAKASKK